MRKVCVLIAVLLALPAAAWAKVPVLVELYTAQGCAACDDADAYAAKLADQPGVLVLTFPVDYWDYLGWTDTFAKPEFADRQKAYVAKLALREPFTPQVVVDGRLQGSAVKTDHVESLIKEARKAKRDPPDIRFVSAGHRVDVGSGHAPKGGGEVWLIRYDPRAQEVSVKTGENRGQTLVQKNVVRQVVRLGDWKGTPIGFKLPAASEEGLKTVVLVQGAHGGRVLGLKAAASGKAAKAST
jgi:hypothetical protein